MKTLLLPWTVFVPALRHGLRAFETILVPGGGKSLAWMLAGLLVFWHIYTPVHELLHVAGCVLGGGSVTELALSPQYGAGLLRRIFPFIVSESEYAGQLTGFSVPNYWSYALVDFFPYLLSLFGVALIEYCRRRNRSFLFGLAMILAFIPFMSIPGDYYEASTLVTTQIAESLDPSLPEKALISDDVFRSIADLHGRDGLNGMTVSLIVLGLLGALYCALLTLAIQVKIAEKIFGPISAEPEDVAEPKSQAVR